MSQIAVAHATRETLVGFYFEIATGKHTVVGTNPKMLLQKKILAIFDILC